VTNFLSEWGRGGLQLGVASQIFSEFPFN